MKIEKQKLVLDILSTGVYEVDTTNAIVYSNRKRGKIKLKPLLLPSCYQQLILFKGRNTGVRVVVYLHQLVYLSHYGLYPDGWEIDHIDRDKNNNSHTNLEPKTSFGNSQNSHRTYYPDKLKLIRANEISHIRQLHSLGNSQASIAKQLGLGRLSVRYIIKRIESGLPLKYE